jgi:hypothetical protein
MILFRDKLHYSTRWRPRTGRPPHIQDKNRTAMQQSSIEIQLLSLSNTSLDINIASESLVTPRVLFWHTKKHFQTSRGPFRTCDRKHTAALHSLIGINQNSF